MPDHAENLGQMDPIIKAFSRSCSLPSGTDWNHREAVAYDLLSDNATNQLPTKISRSDVFLGGDSLRPYLALRLIDRFWIVSREEGALSRPQLIEAVDFGKFGSVERVTISYGSENYLVRFLPSLNAISYRFAVPNVYLASLTNALRYQTRRYPLNIGRLAQWLRFQHAGRVRVADLALNFDGNHNELFDDLLEYSPDILGVSINFGEIESFRKLISSISEIDPRPVICLRNVLPAWAPEEVQSICDGFEVHISSSYGETDLENICRSFAVAGASGKQSDETEVRDNQTRAERWPQVMVLPDEHLLECTLQKGGQASLETSFGCQYSRCSFCPRDHRGRGWQRPSVEDATAVVAGMASQINALGAGTSNILSLVDEDAFGEEGVTPGVERPSIVDLVTVAGNSGTSCEIYTRLEQIFDRRRHAPESLNRIEQLLTMKRDLARVFVGVESGSNSQLRRYAKGQTAAQVMDALRTGALVGLPLEFGFITFDPLLTQEELLENLEFLARRDVLLRPERTRNAEEIYNRVMSKSDEGLEQGEPVFARVAYMATELELFSNSPYLKRLAVTHPELIGKYENSFSRYDYGYQDPVIGSVAAWCRVWTESTFRPIYRMRLASRTIRNASNPFSAVVRRYREATFGLLLILTERFANRQIERISNLSKATALEIPIHLNGSTVFTNELHQLWQWVTSALDSTNAIETVEFNLDSLKQRRNV